MMKLELELEPASNNGEYNGDRPKYVFQPAVLGQYVNLVITETSYRSRQPKSGPAPFASFEDLSDFLGVRDQSELLRSLSPLID